jgi:hypothetical protein
MLIARTQLQPSGRAGAFRGQSGSRLCRASVHSRIKRLAARISGVQESVCLSCLSRAGLLALCTVNKRQAHVCIEQLWCFVLRWVGADRGWRHLQPAVRGNRFVGIHRPAAVPALGPLAEVRGIPAMLMKRGKYTSIRGPVLRGFDRHSMQPGAGMWLTHAHGGAMAAGSWWKQAAQGAVARLHVRRFGHMQHAPVLGRSA